MGDRKYSQNSHPFGKAPEEPPAPESAGDRFSYWFFNKFWYHYKWVVVGVLVVIAFLGVILYMNVASYGYDCHYVVVSYEYIGSEDLIELNAEAKELYGDVNGDGQSICFGRALHFKDSGEAAYDAYAVLATALVDEDIRFFIVEKGFNENYFNSQDGFLDLAALGFETVEGQPWKAIIPGSEMLRRNGFSDGQYCVAIQSPAGVTEELTAKDISFLSLLVGES